jgi:hypothetical protein
VRGRTEGGGARMEGAKEAVDAVLSDKSAVGGAK